MRHALLYVPLLLLCFVCSTQAEPDVNDLRVKWKFKTEGPIRADGVLDGDEIFIASTDGKLYALRKGDGKRLWQLRTRGALASEPAVSENLVVVVSRDAKVYAVHRHNGKIKWTFRMRPEREVAKSGWKYFTAAPVIANGKVYVGSGDGRLYALDRHNGQLLWKFRTRGQIRATPLVQGDTLYQPSNDGLVYALNAESGALLWTFTTDGHDLNPEDYSFDRRSIYATPILVDNTLLIASRDGNVYAVDTGTQTLRWQFSLGTSWAMSTTVDQDTVYVGWSTNNAFSAIDLATGEARWQFHTGSHNYTDALVTANAVYFGSADGKLYQLDKFTGEMLATYTIGREIFSSPLYDAASRSILLGSDDGYFYALQAAEPAQKAVYQPTDIEDLTQYLVVDAEVTPYLTGKGYQHLDSPAALHDFLAGRIADGAPSVVVFALPIIPEDIFGEDPRQGLMRAYLEAGGKVVWFGDPPNYYSLNDAGDNFDRDAAPGSRLVGVDYTNVSESGNYYVKATQQGRNWGLPRWLKSTGTPVTPRDVTVLAKDEFGRVSLWVKNFCGSPGSGFVSVRTWGWNVPINDEDLALVDALARYGLE